MCWKEEQEKFSLSKYVKLYLKFWENKTEALIISKRLITNFPRFPIGTDANFMAPLWMHFERFKSALNILKSDFSVFRKKPSLNGCFLVCYTAVFFKLKTACSRLGAFGLLTYFKSYCKERKYALQSRLTLSWVKTIEFIAYHCFFLKKRSWLSHNAILLSWCSFSLSCNSFF